MDAIRKKMQSPSRVKLMCSMPPSPGLRETPRRLTPNQTDMKLTFVIWAKKFKAMSVNLMKPMTNLPKLRQLLRKRKRPSRPLRRR